MSKITYNLPIFKLKIGSTHLKYNKLRLQLTNTILKIRSSLTPYVKICTKYEQNVSYLKLT